jgi:HSP20 family protein
MFPLTRWEPWNEMPPITPSAILRNLPMRVNHLFEPFRSFWPEESFGPTPARFTPLVDIYENEHKLIVKFEVPGMEERDIEVKIENNTLLVTGERKIEKEEKLENYQRVERYYGTFSRSFVLPTTLELETAFAEYKNGVLCITFNKKAEAKPKQIKVGIHKAEVKVKAV